MANPILPYSKIFEDDGALDDLLAGIDKLEARLVKLAKTVEKDAGIVNPNDEKGLEDLTEQLGELEEGMKMVEKQKKIAVISQKKIKDLTDEELVQREKQKKIDRERVQRAKQLAILMNKESGEIERLRAELAKTTLQWKKLSKEELENSNTGRNLIATKLRLTNQLKKLEKETGDNRREVGNYGKALIRTNKILKTFRKTLVRLFVGRTIIDGIQRLVVGFVDLFNEAKEGNEDFQRFSNTISALIEGIKGIGISILNFVLPIIQAVIRRFQFFSDAIRSAAGEGTFLGAVFDGIKTAVNGVINVLLDLPFILVGIRAVFKAFSDSVSARFNLMALDAERLKLKIQEAFAAITGADATDIRNRLREIDQEFRENLRNVLATGEQVGEVYKNAVDLAREEFAKFEKEQDEIEAKAAAAAKRREDASGKQTKSIKDQNQLLIEQNNILILIAQSETDRIKAIEVLENQLEAVEIDGIKDREKRRRALEQRRFEAEQSQRKANFKIVENLIQLQDQELLLLFGEGSEELKDFRKKADDDLFKIRDLNNQLELEQVKKHEENKLKIREDFAQKTTDLFTGTIESEPLDEADAAAAKASDKRLKKELDNIQKRKDATQQLLQEIESFSEKLGAIITEQFSKQADLAEENVKRAVTAVERARERARQGLRSNLKFEQQELAKRQSEQLAAQNRAQQAAKLTALFNIVAAAAASGDPNAAITGIAQFGLLTAFEAIINQGFDEGGYTGKGNRKGIAGHVHYDEFVVPAKETAKYGLIGKSGDEFGGAMGDYFHQPPLMNIQHLTNRTAEFIKATNKQESKIDFSGLEKEMRETRRAIVNMPNVTEEISKIREDCVEITRAVIKNQMTKTEKRKVHF